MDPAARLPLIGELRPPRLSPPTRDAILRGLVAFRWVVGAWMIGVFVWEIFDRSRTGRPDVAHPLLGIALLGCTAAFQALLTVAYRRDARTLLRPALITTELGVAATLLFLDTLVYGSTHSQALPTIWPVAVIFSVAVAAGGRAAVVAGLGLGLVRYVGWLLFPTSDLGPIDSSSPWSMARVASTVLFAVAGWVAGYLLDQQERSDRAISAFRAREEVARTLHDGVLQTLAVIQRRSDDQALVHLARSQEHELREFLFGARTADQDIAAALRAAGRRAEQRYGISVQVICAPDLPLGDERAIAAIGGATGEALTNAARHGGADRATVYAEPGDPDDIVFVSIKDNGVGFDVASATMGEGIRRSIHGRVTELGGRSEVDGRPGRGAEVRLWVPLTRRHGDLQHGDPEGREHRGPTQEGTIVS